MSYPATPPVKDPEHLHRIIVQYRRQLDDAERRLAANEDAARKTIATVYLLVATLIGLAALTFGVMHSVVNGDYSCSVCEVRSSAGSEL